MCSLINKQLLLTAYAYLFITEQQKGQQRTDAIQLGIKSNIEKNDPNMSNKMGFIDSCLKLGNEPPKDTVLATINMAMEEVTCLGKALGVGLESIVYDCTIGNKGQMALKIMGKCEQCPENPHLCESVEHRRFAGEWENKEVGILKALGAVGENQKSEFVHPLEPRLKFSKWKSFTLQWKESREKLSIDAGRVRLSPVAKTLGSYFTNDVSKMPDTQKAPLTRKIVLQLMNGLDYVHEKGIFHRDIKPDNILVTVGCDTNDARFSDFGFADRDWDGYSRGTQKYLSLEMNTTKLFSDWKLRMDDRPLWRSTVKKLLFRADRYALMMTIDDVVFSGQKHPAPIVPGGKINASGFLTAQQDWRLAFIAADVKAGNACTFHAQLRQKLAAVMIQKNDATTDPWKDLLKFVKNARQTK